MAEILTGKAESKKEYSVNISDAKSSEAILKIVAAELGWKQVTQPLPPPPPPSQAPASALAAYRASRTAPPPPRGSIVWVVCPEALELAIIGRKGEQRVSHIPGMHGLCRKGPFALLGREHKLRTPRTWVVEVNAAPASDVLAVLRKDGCLILKPNDGTQGDGIFLVRSATELKRLLERQTQSVVLQRYIANPLLLPAPPPTTPATPRRPASASAIPRQRACSASASSRNAAPAAEGSAARLKFDVRLYALILSTQPRRFYLCGPAAVRTGHTPLCRPYLNLT